VAAILGGLDSEWTAEQDNRANSAVVRLRVYPESAGCSAVANDQTSPDLGVIYIYRVVGMKHSA
jgi:hypothetical protein